MILSCQNISKAFLEVPVLKNISFHIEDNDKAAIVGNNGAGKSTLLKIIVGEYQADDGSVVIGKDARLGYLAQSEALDEADTIIEALRKVKQSLIDMEAQIRSMESKMSEISDSELSSFMEQYEKTLHTFDLLGGYTYQSEITGVLNGLGFMEDSYNQSIKTLSGGQKTRVALGKLLLEKPDLLILDEPTNHLDLNSIKWLEGYLKNYDKAVLIVSHDRYFLDRIANKVIEIEQHAATVFTGNYTDYAAKKEIIRVSKLKAYLNQQEQIKHQEAVIEKLKSFNREKSIKRAESREKQLDKIERLEKPVEENNKMNIRLEPEVQSGKDVLKFEGLSKAYGNKVLFSGLEGLITRGEHIALIGDNGTGKTTILKILNNLETADSGSFSLGSRVEVGYYDQEHHVLDSDKTLFEEISDAYPDMNNTKIRNTLAAFLFTGDDVFKRIKDLSGGEKGRLSLAKLMLSKANFLILDEPTNHLDIASKEILEDALNNYDGTVLYVSHDRYFINKTAHRILELENKNLTQYLGNYDYYLEKKNEFSEVVIKENVTSANASVSAPTANNNDWAKQKEEQARRRKLENELKKCEERIEFLENEIKAIEDEMALPDVCTNVGKLNELSKKHEAYEQELNECMEKWEELSE